MLHIYYGLGKGKTSTLNGSALRAHGAHLRVAYFRFLKGRLTHEDAMLEQLGIKVINSHPSPKFVMQMNPEERAEALAAVQATFAMILANKEQYDVIILDELLDLAADTVGFCTDEQLCDFLNQLSKQEVLVSGHIKLPQVFNAADLITRYEDEKHYFTKGVQARAGFEY